jgi:hypothetical protein
MHLLARLQRYDEDIAQFVHEMDLHRTGFGMDLAIEDGMDLILGTQALLETHIAKDLQAIAIFVETGEGNPWTVNVLINSLLNRLFALPYVPGRRRHVPDEFWMHPVGGLLIKALCRIHGDQLITITDAAKRAGVSRATVSIAIDKGDITGIIDPAARRRQGHRRVLLSEVLARWVEKESSPPPEPVEEWTVFEHRVPAGNQVVIVFDGIIVNQWVTIFGKTQKIEGHPFLVLGTERHEKHLGNPDWIGQPVAVLTGRYFRQVRIPEEITRHLHMHVSLGGGKTPLPSETLTEEQGAHGE